MQAINYKGYSVYSDGRVWRPARTLTRSDGVARNFKGGWAATRTHTGPKGAGGGYVRIDLYIPTPDGPVFEYWSLHRLVAMLFIPNPNMLPDVNHKDGVRNHNWKGNLEWMTRSDNQKHAYRTGIRAYHGMSDEMAKAIWHARNVQKRKLLDVANEFSVSLQTVSRIAKGEHHAFKP